MKIFIITLCETEWVYILLENMENYIGDTIRFGDPIQNTSIYYRLNIYI